MAVPLQISKLKKIVWPIALFWALCFVAAIFYGEYLHQQNIYDIAEYLASNTFGEDLMYRSWVAQQGGVYVPVSENLKPNPYLSDIVVDRDVTTLSGRKLTLVNPAYMVRLVQELAEKMGARLIKTHITSLKPLRPENQPDRWERSALAAFAKGRQEVILRTTVAGELYLRYIRRLMVKKRCLKCHASQGYKEGEVRGGISVSLPIMPLQRSLRSQVIIQNIIYSLIFLLGCGGLVLAFMHYKKYLLAASEQQLWLEALFNLSPVGIAQVRERVLLNVNDRFCQMLGYSRDELIGEDAVMLYPDRVEYQKAAELYRDLNCMEVKMQRKDNTIFDILLTSTHLAPENLAVGTIFTVTDISTMKDTERELALSEKKFRGIMETTQDLVYICSIDFRVEYMNPAMARRVGRDAAGESCFRAIHGLSEPCSWCKRNEREWLQNPSLTVVSPLDDRTYIESHSVLDPAVESSSILVVFKDITDIEETRQQLQQSQKMEAIGTLAGGVAHDFNNILTVIRGHAEMGLMTAAPESREHQDFTAIEKASERAKRLTYQLLAFSRKQRIAPERVNLNHFLSELNKMLRRLVDEDITLATSCVGKLGSVLLDPSQLDQLVVNLVVNAVDAIKSSNANDKVVTIATSHMILNDVFIAAHPGSTRGEFVELKISDTGAGMDAATIAHIFEPFYTTKELGKGTGLGLSTVYGIVKQNGGYIDVVSEPGVGSTFKIYFPVIKALAAEVDTVEADRSLPVSLVTETILVVEDDDSIRSVTREHLQNRGYTVIVAENGAAALAKIKTTAEPIDLLFTDVVMPKMNGRELGEKIRQLYPEVEILYTSGYASTNVWENSVSPPAHRFLDKPYTQRELLSKIRELLDGRKEPGRKEQV